MRVWDSCLAVDRKDVFVVTVEPVGRALEVSEELMHHGRVVVDAGDLLHLVEEHRGVVVAVSCFRVQGSRVRVQGTGCRVQGAGCRVQGAGCRVQGWGLGCCRAPRSAGTD